MAQKPSLSPSKISTYLACPTKYGFTYVDPRGRWYLRSKSYYSFGTSLHAVLQRFHDENDQGVTTTEQAVSALEESWIDAGYDSHEEMMQALSEGKAMLSAHVDRHRREPVTAQTLFVEKTFKMDMGPFVLVGKLDRVDKYDDGTIDIIDYKSGRDTVTSADVEGELAMGCYQLLIRNAYPGDPVRATIIALRSGVRASSQMSDPEAEVFTRDIVAIGQEILNRDFESLVPRPKAICHDCDFLPLCQKHPDFGPLPAGA